MGNQIGPRQLIRMNGASGETGLFEKLDENEDKVLSLDELALTTRMRKADLDDDESIGVDELRPTSNPYYFVDARFSSSNRSGCSTPLRLSIPITSFAANFGKTTVAAFDSQRSTAL